MARNFSVSVTGVSTATHLQDQHAAGNATVTAALNAAGTRITFTDTTGGSGNFTIGRVPTMSATAPIFNFNAGSGGTLTGSNITFSTDDAFRATHELLLQHAGQLRPPVQVCFELHQRRRRQHPRLATAGEASLNPTGNGIQLVRRLGRVGRLATAINSLNSAMSGRINWGLAKPPPRNARLDHWR